MGKELSDEKVFVALPAVLGVDIEGLSRRRRSDQEVADLVRLPHPLNYVPERPGDGLLVLAEPVQVVQDGELAVEIGAIGAGEDHAIGDLTFKDGAVNASTVDARLREHRR